MHWLIRPTILAFVYLPWLGSGHAGQVTGQERSGEDVKHNLIATLRVASDVEIAAARSSAIDQLNVFETDLSKRAIGVVLRNELQIGRLATELQKLHPDPAVLREIALKLRRPLTGQMRNSDNELRKRVQQLAVLVSLTPDRIEDVLNSVELLTGQLNPLQSIPQVVNESEFRRAFEVLANLHPSASRVKSLRARLSAPNHRVLVKRDLVTSIARRSFDVPVNIHQNVNSTDITANGQMHITTSAELPESAGQSQVWVTVSGHGQVGIRATREITRLQALTAAQITGTQRISITPTGVHGDHPFLQAQFCTRLTAICLDGLLGNCNFARRIASRVAQNALAQNDVSAARKFEQSAQPRIESEGNNIADQLNQLIQRAYWEELQAFDVNPEVHIRNDQAGIVSDATYARSDQLGALTAVPRIPPEIDRRLDLITWVHESMINNASDNLSGLRLDEVTVRELWEQEFKLTSDEWVTRLTGRIPVRMTLATGNPVHFRFADQGIEILLRTVSCELDGTVQDIEPREFRMRYQLVKDGTSTHFIRDEMVPAIPLPPEKADTWQVVLERFFAKTLRPAAKFCNREQWQWMRLEHLELDGGWLIVGAARTPNASSIGQNASIEKP